MHIGAILDSVDRTLATHRAAAKAAASRAERTHPIVMAASGPSESLLGYNQQTTRQTEQYKHNVGWVYTAINRIATKVSGLPYHMGRALPAEASRGLRSLVKRHGFGRVDAAWQARFGRRLLSPLERSRAPDYVKQAPSEVEMIERHELLDALAKPNEMLVAANLFLVTVASLELTGLTYWWLPRVDGRLQIWHLPTDWVTPRHTEDTLYDHYEVKPPNRLQDAVPIPAEEIMRVVLPDPSDPHKTVSPAQTQAPAIAADEAIQVAQARQFKNDMFPGLIITMGRHPDIQGKPGERIRLTPRQRKDMVESLRAIYEGSVNYREPFIVDRLIEKVDRMTYNPAEMDYVNSGGVTKSRIMQAYGVNPFISGENVTVGWGQASVAEEVFLAQVVNPLGTLLGQSITTKTRADGHLFWFEEAAPRNPELKLKRYMVALNNKAGPMVTEEEFRQEILGLGPREEEEEQPPVTDESEEEHEDEDEELSDVGEPPRRPMPSQRRAPLLGRLEKHARLIKAVRPQQADLHERDMASAMQGFFRRVAKTVSSNLDAVPDDLLARSESAGMVRDLVYRPVDWRAALREAATQPLERAVLTGYLTARRLFDDLRSQIKQAGLKKPPQWVLESQWVGELGWPEGADWLADWDLPEDVVDGIRATVDTTLAQPYWEKILEETGEQVAATVRTGAEESWNRHKFKQKIMDDIGENPVRAKRIARTEITGAMNGGHRQQAVEMESLGLHPIKVWLIVGDGLEREAHYDMDGEEAHGADGMFDIQGYLAPYPGFWSLPAELRINCRCGYLTDLAELRTNGEGT